MEKNTGYILTTLAIATVILASLVTYTPKDSNINIDINIEGKTGESVETGNSLGALGDPNPINLDTDEWTATNDLLVDDLEVNDDAFILGDLTVAGESLIGAGVVTQSSTTNETLTQAQICSSNYIAYTPINALNLTLPATSTISSCLKTAGSQRTIVIENAATTTNAITIVAGAGMDLQEPDGQNVVIGQNNFAWITFVKQPNGDIVTRVDETIPAD